MTEMIKLQCPSCGGKLEVGNDFEQFACGYCGTAVMVRRRGGTVSLAPVVEGLASVQRGVDRTASELAMNRLKPEIARLRSTLQAQVKSQQNYITLMGVGVMVMIAGLVGCISMKDDGAVAFTFGLIFGAPLFFIGRGGKRRVTPQLQATRATVDQCEKELQQHYDSVRL